MSDETRERLDAIDAKLATVMRWHAKLQKELDDAPTPGTGACICKHSPESFLRNCTHWNELPEVSTARMNLDHRCPQHGEKAQPALWGRHREKELVTSWAQWDSLGLKRKVQP